ncbi:MAG: carbonic anhydrase [Candidatus Krumholzibacteriota bacterium]|nr:carbonic anhydrase [Candidatus Krumholzibacteriota bacterium]
MNSAEALERLLEGNARFASGKVQAPGRTAERRIETAGGQFPYAVILTCSDSRVPPEIIFDEGIGDLFVVRVAGNVTDDLVTGSIEYAVRHLSVTLVVVLGHNNCGAVNAAWSQGIPEGHTASFIDAIRPVIGRSAGSKGDDFVDANVRDVAETLRNSEPVLRHLVDQDRLSILGAHYDLSSGKVSLVD